MQRPFARLSGVLTALGLVLGILVLGHSAPVTFTDKASFDAAIAGLSSATLDFDSLPADTLIASGDTVDGITFTFNIAGLDMIVSDIFDTTSPTNYLGLDDGADEVFLSGDTFTMTFDRTLVALGLFVIGSPGDVLAGDVALAIATGSVFNAGTPDQVLGDGGEAFFLGLLEPTGFTMAELISFDPQGLGLFEFTVDDITTATPEPSTLLLFASGLLGVAAWGRRRLRQPPMAGPAD